MVATLTCRAGQRDAAAAAFQPYLDNVKAEDGTQLYILHAKDETTLLIYELYRDEAAAKDHTAGMRKVRCRERRASAQGGERRRRADRPR